MPAIAVPQVASADVAMTRSVIWRSASRISEKGLLLPWMRLMVLLVSGSPALPSVTVVTVWSALSPGPRTAVNRYGTILTPNS